MRDFEAFSPNWDVFSNHIPRQYSGIYVLKKEEKLQESEVVSDSRKQHLLNTAGLVHKGTQRDCDGTHKGCTHLNQTNKQHWENGAKKNSHPDYEAIWY